MPAYQYRAMNQKGVEIKGVIEADADLHARTLLRQQQLIPLEVSQAKKKTDTKKRFWQRSASINTTQLALMTRQFSTLLAAGLPIEEALFAVSEQTEQQRVKTILLSVRSKVLEGHALATALKDYPESFSPLYCATIASGEKSGHLDKVLVRLADYTEQQASIKQKLKTALIYPAMIVLVAFGIVGFLLEYVVPKMVTVYAHMNQSLPVLTTVLISISNNISAYGLYVFMMMIVSAYLFKRALSNNPVFRKKTHAVLLRLPLIGYALRTSDTARFARTLAILSSSGVSILEAMTIATALVNTVPIKDALQVALLRVREGAAMHYALKQTTYFSPMSVHMIASGEASGQLESMLNRVADMQENALTRMIDVGLSLFEPAVILLMGAIVLFIVLAVLLPIFNLNDLA